MTPNANNPVNFKNIVTSQFGEDGIIEEIFKRIGTENKFCVEFGAWDGKWLSNTWDLWHNKEWSALLIEGDAERCQSLERDLQGFEKVRSYQAYVAIEGEDSLDNILTRMDAPSNLDLLSIDIDSDDYYIFESLQDFKPRLLVIEYNPTIPPEIDLIQERGEYFGASALALVNLARKKGYGLVCCTDSNCFFVLQSEYPKLNIAEPSLEEVFVRDHLTYVITSADGRPFLSRKPTYVDRIDGATLRNLIKSRRLARFYKHPKLIVRGPEDVRPIRLFYA